MARNLLAVLAAVGALWAVGAHAQNWPAPTTPLSGSEPIPCIQSNAYASCTPALIFQSGLSLSNVWTGSNVYTGALVSVDSALKPSLGAPGARGRLFIWSNPTTIAAGQNAGEQIWIGSNPTATPGAGDFIGLTIGIDNISRGPVWAINTICNQLAIAQGGVAGINHCQENDITQSFAPNNANDPLGGGGSVSHAFEGVAQSNTSGSAHHPQQLFWTWSANAVGNGASDTAYGAYIATRVEKWGFTAEDYTGDGTYGFSVCAFCDYSHQSATVLTVSQGSHTNLIDISGVTAMGSLIRAPTGADFTGGYDNFANHNLELQISSGNHSGGVTQQSRLALADQGVDKWQIVKDASNNFNIFNFATSSTDIQVNGATDLVTINHGVTVAGGNLRTAVGYTVSTLPSCTAGIQGTRTFVTDASAATYSVGASVAGSGSNVIPVFCNGSGWIAG